MSGGKNSFFRKPLGSGKKSVSNQVGGALNATGAALGLGAEKIGGMIGGLLGSGGAEDAAIGELSAADKARAARLADNLEKDMNGNENSLAIAQYKDAQNDLVNNAMALQTSQKGGSNPALNARNVANVTDMQGQELANQSAQMKMQERQNAINSMNSYLAAKQGVAMQNAQMQNQANIAAQQSRNQLLGNIGQGIAMYAASDKNLKENIEPSKGDANNKVAEFLDSLKGYNFDYKDEKFGKGEKTGVMAQDLEKTDLGKSMVVETDEGKMVDFAQGFGTLIAAQAELKKELDSLKKGKKHA